MARKNTDERDLAAIHLQMADSLNVNTKVGTKKMASKQVERKDTILGSVLTWEQTQAEQQRAAEEFRALAPLRMLELMLEAQELGMPTGLGRNKDGALVLTVTTQQKSNGAGWESIHDLSLNGTSWDFQQLAGEIQSVRAERAEEARLEELARTTYDSLSVEQRKALGLKFRP